jgi:hypothetical protein
VLYGGFIVVFIKKNIIPYLPLYLSFLSKRLCNAGILLWQRVAIFLSKLMLIDVGVVARYTTKIFSYFKSPC